MILAELFALMKGANQTPPTGEEIAKHLNNSPQAQEQVVNIDFGQEYLDNSGIKSGVTRSPNGETHTLSGRGHSKTIGSAGIEQVGVEEELSSQSITQIINKVLEVMQQEQDKSWGFRFGIQELFTELNPSQPVAIVAEINGDLIQITITQEEILEKSEMESFDALSATDVATSFSNLVIEKMNEQDVIVINVVDGAIMTSTTSADNTFLVLQNKDGGIGIISFGKFPFGAFNIVNDSDLISRLEDTLESDAQTTPTESTIISNNADALNDESDTPLTPSPTETRIESLYCGEIVGTVGGNNINLRADKSTESRIVDTLNRNEEMIVISQADGEDRYLWYQVRTDDNQVGWVRSDLFNLGEPTTCVTQNFEVLGDEVSVLISLTSKNVSVSFSNGLANLSYNDDGELFPLFDITNTPHRNTIEYLIEYGHIDFGTPGRDLPLLTLVQTTQD